LLLLEKPGDMIASSIKRPHRFRRSERMTKRQKTPAFPDCFRPAQTLVGAKRYLHWLVASSISAITRAEDITTNITLGVTVQRWPLITARRRKRTQTQIHTDAIASTITIVSSAFCTLVLSDNPGHSRGSTDYSVRV
jgi:hypothetical protein